MGKRMNGRGDHGHAGAGLRGELKASPVISRANLRRGEQLFRFPAFSDRQLESIESGLALAKTRHQQEAGRPMSPHELRFAIYDQIHKARCGGFSTTELTNLTTDDGKKIERIEMAIYPTSDPMKSHAQRVVVEGEGAHDFGNVQLADPAVRFVIDSNEGRLAASQSQYASEDKRKLVMQLAASTGVTTQQGNTAGDRAMVESTRDTGVYGGTTALIGPAMLNEMLRIRSRRADFNQWMRFGVAPELFFEIPAKMNNALMQLFDAGNSGRLAGKYAGRKSTVLPRQEMGVAGTWLRPKYDKYSFESIGYLLYAMISMESLTSPAARMLGLWEDDLNDLLEGMGLIDGYDFIQSAWYGHYEGTQRRHEAGGSWVDTEEIPRGSAHFVTTNALKHWRWWDMENFDFWKPQAGSNYNKYQSADTQEDAMLFPVGNNKFVELVVMLNQMQILKGRKLDAIQLPVELLPMLALDEKTLNRDWAVETEGRFDGQKGYSGTVTIPMVGKVALFFHEPGDVPIFADANDLDIDHLIWGGELGKMVKHYPYWSQELTVFPGQQVVTDDESRSQVVPSESVNGRIVNLRCQEVDDLDSVSFIRGMLTAHTGAT